MDFMSLRRCRRQVRSGWGRGARGGKELLGSRWSNWSGAFFPRGVWRRGGL